MGQYVTRGEKKYYKADDGKLYSNFQSAYAAQKGRLVEEIFGIPPNTFKPLELQLNRVAGGIGSGIMSGLKQLGNLGRSAYAVVDPQGAQEAELENWLRTGSMGSSDTGRSSERQGPTRDIYEQPGVGYFDRSSGRFLGSAPSAPQLPTPGSRDAAPGQRATPIVQSSDDQYRQLLSQYGALTKAGEQEKAEKLGMEIWNKKYGKTAMAQPGGAVGARNPLMEKMFGYQAGASATNPSYAGSKIGSEDFAMAANAVPAPWNQQGVKVSSDFSGVVPFQAAKTTGEGMPAFQTTGEKAEEFLRNVKLSNLF